MAFSITLNQLKAAVDDAMAKEGIIGVAEIRFEYNDVFIDVEGYTKDGPCKGAINLEDVYSSGYHFGPAMDKAVRDKVENTSLRQEDF